MNTIKVINTGGTFNKVYNKLSGNLEIKPNNKQIIKILKKVFIKNQLPKIEGIIYKDSLDMTNKDRKILLEAINNSKENQIIIIHGTDTMDKSAVFLDGKISNDKQIVFVGAMVPASINAIEATGNLMFAYGFLKHNRKNGIYIAMNGIVDNYKKVVKNRKKGFFECH